MADSGKKKKKVKLGSFKLGGICTDGAPAMTGKKNSPVALQETFLDRKLLKYHLYPSGLFPEPKI